MADKDKKMSATEKWAAKNKKSAKPSDLGKGAARNAASALKDRQARVDAAIEGYTFNGKKAK